MHILPWGNRYIYTVGCETILKGQCKDTARIFSNILDLDYTTLEIKSILLNGPLLVAQYQTKIISI
jgi:hypothetical protein